MNALRVLIVMGFVATAPRAAMACRWFGTQLECDFGARRVLIGTQAADEPTYVRPFRPQAFNGGDGLVDHRTPGRPLELELQNIGADPRLCRRIGNETYCY